MVGTAMLQTQAPAVSAVAEKAVNNDSNGAAPQRMYVQYDTVHDAIASALPMLQQEGWSNPDYLVAISGGGLIPARILRSILRHNAGSQKGQVAVIKVIGLELYDEDLDGKARDTGIIRTQWLELAKTDLVGKKILIVDEVDDSRTTLEYAVRELLVDINAQTQEARAQGQDVPDTQLGVFVIHNKQRPKKGVLPAGVHQFVAQEVEGNPWIVYPWDAIDIHEHNRLGSL